ncbi:jg2699, partial [Pararge aegeria aegeria]
FGSVFLELWNPLCAMAREPHPQLAQMAADIVAYVSNQVSARLYRLACYLLTTVGHGITAF